MGTLALSFAWAACGLAIIGMLFFKPDAPIKLVVWWVISFLTLLSVGLVLAMISTFV